MKNAILILPLFFAVISHVAAYGERGAAERILYYAAYLAEEVYLTDGQFTIAPGCVGSRPAKRCNFLEMLLHIWKPGEEDKGYPGPTLESTQAEPKQNEKGLGKVKELRSFLQVDYDDLHHKLMSWAQRRIAQDSNGHQIWTEPKEVKGRDGKPILGPDGQPKMTPAKKLEEKKSYSLVGLNDWSKTVRGAKDWYDSLSKCSGPLATLSKKLANKEIDDKYTDLWRKGKAAADRVVELRRLDFEQGADGKGKGRLTFLETRVRELLDVPEGDSKKLVQQMDDPHVSNFGKGTFKILDAQKTISDNEKAHPNIKDVLLQAQGDYVAKSSRNAEHGRALDSAKIASTGCSCGLS